MANQGLIDFKKDFGPDDQVEVNVVLKFDIDDLAEEAKEGDVAAQRAVLAIQNVRRRFSHKRVICCECAEIIDRTSQYGVAVATRHPVPTENAMCFAICLPCYEQSKDPDAMAAQAFLRLIEGGKPNRR